MGDMPAAREQMGEAQVAHRSPVRYAVWIMGGWVCVCVCVFVLVVWAFCVTIDNISNRVIYLKDCLFILKAKQ